MNEHCKCNIESGWCTRHQINKSAREVEFCKGIANTPSGGRLYWDSWEQGKLNAIAPPDPILSPPGFATRAIGFGSKLSNGISAVTGGLIKPCTSCKGRAAVLNHYLPAKDLPPVLPVEFAEPVKRNFMMHIWPVKGFGAWQWNLDQVLKRAELFNGRRVVAIVTSHDADHPDMVKEYLKDFTDDFIVMPNNPKKREGVTFIPLLEKLEESIDLNEVTFYCQSKAVRHKIAPDTEGTTLFHWTAAMYETLLDNWPTVQEALRTKAMAGSFKRYGSFRTRGNNRWHFSGAFHWFRNSDVFQRNWRYLDTQFFAVESWPGLMFKAEETACIFLDNAQDLYQTTYFDSVVQPALEEWRKAHAVQSTT